MSNNVQYPQAQQQYVGAIVMPMAAPPTMKDAGIVSSLPTTYIPVVSGITSNMNLYSSNMGVPTNHTVSSHIPVISFQRPSSIQPLPTVIQHEMIHQPSPPVNNLAGTSSVNSQQDQKMQVGDALSYLDQVKHKFRDQPEVYNYFLHIMKEFKAQRISTSDVIKRVSELFKGHSELIIGFNTYLPPVYKIELQTNEQGSENICYSIVDNTSNNLTIHGPSPTSTTVYDIPQISVTQTEAVSQSLSQQPEAVPITSQAQSSQPIDFNHAMGYISKIKNRFHGHPDKYKRFLKILHTYQKEQRNLKDSSHSGKSKSSSSLTSSVKNFTESEVFSQVAELFENQEDLLREFRQFLPNALKHHRSLMVETPTPSASNSGSSSRQSRKLKMESALSYLDQVKIKFTDQPLIYKDFLSIMKELKSQTIDIAGAIRKVVHLFKGHPDLIMGFNTFLSRKYKIEIRTSEDGYTVSIPSSSTHRSAHTRQNSNTSSESPRTTTSPPQPPKGQSNAPVIQSTGSTHQMTTNNSLSMHEPSSPLVVSTNYSRTTQSQAVNQVPGGTDSVDGVQQYSPINYNQASNYVNKIKSRFQSQPDKYKHFLKIIHTYQKEQLILKETGHMNRNGGEDIFSGLTKTEVYSQIAELFENQEDLMLEFEQFLPFLMNQPNTLVFDEFRTDMEIDEMSESSSMSEERPTSVQPPVGLLLTESGERRTPDPRVAALDDLYTCSLCGGYVIPEYRVCSKGHPICQGCVDTWGRCPLRCDPVRWETEGGRRAPVYFSRYHSYETAVERVQFSCRYRDEGCSSYFLPCDYLRHLDECPFRPPPISPNTAARINGRLPTPIPVPASPPPGDGLHKQIRHEMFGSCPSSPSLRLTKLLSPTPSANGVPNPAAPPDEPQASPCFAFPPKRLAKFAEASPTAATLDGTPSSAHCHGKDNSEDIISKKSLDVVKDVIILLKQHSREEGLFRRSGRRILREHILGALRRGDRLQISNTPDAAKECAAALQLYLAQMKTPVMPERVQQLLLADNPGITAHTIAHDALGLIRQDVVGRHSELLVDLLGLLKHLLIFPPPSERTELQAPALVNNFLPVFFNFETDDITKRRQVATRLNELIIEAPELLMRKKKPMVTNSVVVVGNESNNLARIRDLPLFTPLMRLVENRNSYHLGEAARAFARPIRRQTVGRLHPAIVRARS